LWLLCNVSINYFNSYVLGHTNFHYPFLFSLCNKAISIFVLSGATTMNRLVRGMPLEADKVWEQLKRPSVLAFGTLTGVNVGLNNWSLMLMTLTLNQVIKSATPLPTALLSILFEGKQFGWQLYASMSVLVVGCVLAAWGAFDQDFWLGILLCVISVLLTSAWVVAAAILTQRGNEPFGAVNLILVSSPMTIITLLVFFCSLELPHLINREEEPDRPVPPLSQMILYVTAGGLLSCLYDVLHNQFVKLTSSVNVSIMGNAKLALLITLSMITLERPPTGMRVVGVSVAFAAVLWYSAYSVYAKSAAAATSLPSAQSSVEDGKKDPHQAPSHSSRSGRHSEKTGLLSSSK